MWEPEIDFVGLMEDAGGDGQKYYYGLGWMGARIDGRKVVHHAGSTGTASSFTMIDVDNGLAVSLLSNVDLTLIDRYQYVFGLGIVNNILHLAMGDPTTDYAIPKIEDPTVNQYELPEKSRYKFIGHYQHKQGGDNFIYYDQPDMSITSNHDTLIGTIYRQEQMINQFRLDFINPTLAVSRNIAKSFIYSISGRENGKF